MFCPGQVFHCKLSILHSTLFSAFLYVSSPHLPQCCLSSDIFFYCELSSRLPFLLEQGSSTFWVRGPIYIFHIILRAAVIAVYKIIMDNILNIIIGAWAARQAKPNSPTLTLLHLRHCSFYNPSAALPTSQLFLHPFRCFTYVICTSPTSQLILQPFRRFTYVTGHSITLPLLHLRHRNFIWRAAHAWGDEKQFVVD